MSELAKQARQANRDKAERMTRADPHQKVDASSWTPPDALNADVQTGPKPTGRQHRKTGGKVEGAHAKARADKTPRRAKKADGGSFVPTERFQFNQGPSHLSRSMGLKTGGKASVSDGEIEGTRPTGGRLAKKDGGRASKGKMNVNIVIATGKPDQGAAPAMPPHPPIPMPPPGAGLPPGGLGAGGPPMPPPGMMGAPQGMPPMPRKRGGRTAYPIDAGAGSGEGRLDKIEAYGRRR